MGSMMKVVLETFTGGHTEVTCFPEDSVRSVISHMNLENDSKTTPSGNKTCFSCFKPRTFIACIHNGMELTMDLSLAYQGVTDGSTIVVFMKKAKFDIDFPIFLQDVDSSLYKEAVDDRERNETIREQLKIADMAANISQSVTPSEKAIIMRSIYFGDGERAIDPRLNNIINCMNFKAEITAQPMPTVIPQATGISTDPLPYRFHHKRNFPQLQH
ncbi:hypothetical protein TRFO_38248 [Tritrichomonas foetus]|uniref:Ubiquitin-like domain-containing protein n=1 Tax=Tritrichomonas foetus TaxID=1144522 RepID=A0A1J4J903_9EUKA|nr:hypothetical protein TRFO_38248 [Tritrichomonas foetus]|eukprot:OHS95624.1 hypothetical protein TRFO_38248 [Tritrichomonas foetus]